MYFYTRKYREKGTRKHTFYEVHYYYVVDDVHTLQRTKELISTGKE